MPGTSNPRPGPNPEAAGGRRPALLSCSSDDAQPPCGGETPAGRGVLVPTGREPCVRYTDIAVIRVRIQGIEPGLERSVRLVATAVVLGPLPRRGARRPRPGTVAKHVGLEPRVLDRFINRSVRPAA